MLWDWIFESWIKTKSAQVFFLDNFLKIKVLNKILSKKFM